MKFVDEVRVYARSGKGGDGCVSFLREKFRPRGGPDGGDGGDGGHVLLVADENLSTLLDFRYQQHYRAENGQPGKGKQMYGRKGRTLRVRVPVGTLVTDADTGELLEDLDGHHKEVVAVYGGKGGRGNMHFATSTNQAPRRAEKGEPAEERTLRLTLKLMADVGLVGFPNAGKSTLISRISAARPKIAAYPFTTLTPNLGMVRRGDDDGFVVADIPGLIRGAADGAGLGHRFLRHVERVSVLAFILSISDEAGRDPVSDYHVLVRELEQYGGALADKPRLLVLTKADLPETEDVQGPLDRLAECEGLPFCVVSPVTGRGVEALVHTMADRVRPRV